MSDDIQMLGRYFGEAELNSYLQKHGITQAPVLKKREDDTGLLNQPAGLELTFTREDALDVPAPDRYPEGALVLSNIRFYGHGNDGWSAYQGELPFGLAFGMTAEAASACFDLPAASFLGGKKLRWLTPTCTVFAKFSKDSLIECAVQLPLPTDLQ